MIDKVKGYNTFLWVYTQKRHVHYEVKSFSRWKSPDDGPSVKSLPD